MNALKYRGLLNYFVLFCFGFSLNVFAQTATDLTKVSKEQLKLYASEIEDLSQLQPLDIKPEDFLIEGDQDALNAGSLALKERILEASHQIAKMYIIASKVKPLVSMVSPDDLQDEYSSTLAIYQTNTAEFQAAFNRMIVVLTNLDASMKYDFQAAVKMCQSTVCSTALLVAFKSLQQVGIGMNQDLDVSKLASWSLNLPYQNNFITRSISEAMNDLVKPNQADPYYSTILRASFSPFLSLVTRGQSFAVKFKQVFTKLTLANIHLMATSTASSSWLVNLNHGFNVFQNQQFSRTAKIENSEWSADAATTSQPASYQSFYQLHKDKWFAVKIKRRRFVCQFDSTGISIRSARSPNTYFIRLERDKGNPVEHYTGMFRGAAFDAILIDQGDFFTFTLTQNGRVLLSDELIGRQHLISIKK